MTTNPITAPPQESRAQRLVSRIDTIYLEPQVREYPRGREILARYPDAELKEVDSHWLIPGLHGNEGNVERWTRIKRETLVLGVKKSTTCRPNGRSSDFIAPSQANGCAMACAYCYVPRRKGFANPISAFVNIEQISRAIERHAARQPPKRPSQTDPHLYVYDIGENSDCSVDAALSDNVKDLVDLFKRIPNAKGSFATKLVNDDLLTYDPQGKTRVRFSLMPQRTATVVDVATDPIATRIAAIDRFQEAGYEVHLNFSPVIVHEGWTEDWAELLTEIADRTSDATKRQLKAEVIFLTHNDRLHEVNLGWHPKAEELLWRPDLQETKRSQTGGINLRYKSAKKRKMLSTFTELVQTHLPDCEIRYAF